MKQLQKHNLKLKKSFGQNFIFDGNITDKIVKCALPLSNTVIEIGPGAGILTKSILKYDVNDLIIVEKDKGLMEVLNPLCDKHKNLKIVYADILQIPVWNLGSAPREIIANLPYNVSTKILLNLLKNIKSFTKMTMMFQKEVAIRITAKPGQKNYGRLSIISQLVTKPKILFNIPNHAFVPKPKVESAVVQFITREKRKFIFNFENIENMTKIMFSKRRKMLRNIFKEHNKKGFLNLIDIDENKRPEELTLEEFCKLERHLYKY